MHLEIIELHPDPVIGRNHPDAAGNRFGFECGRAFKHDGRYVIFTTECFDEPKTACSRLAIWTSDDGLHFRRHSTIVETNYDWQDTTSFRMAPWQPQPVFDVETDRWHLFHVAYSRKPGSSVPYNMHGRTARLESLTPGWAGLLGPYIDRGFVELTGPRGDWEGPGNEVGFYPYRLDDGWCAFFGGNTVPEEVGDNQHFFGVGLARAASICGPWQRLAEHNPVLLDPTFVENPVVDRLAPDCFVTVYDGATEGGIAYACSADGIHWGAEQVMRWASAPGWLKAPRTPLGLIHEQGNEYTLYFTAFDGLYPDGFVEPWWHDGFGNVGLARVRVV